jgi:hypothetical protein
MATPNSTIYSVLVSIFSISALVNSPASEARDQSFQFSNPAGHISAEVRDIPGTSMKIIVFYAGHRKD